MAAATISRARLTTLLKRLEAHALGDAPLNPSQIKAIELLIRKDAAAGPASREGERREIVFHVQREILCPQCRAVHNHIPDQ